MKLVVNLPEELKSRAAAAFPSMSMEDLAVKAIHKSVADAELQLFAAVKKAEVDAKAKALNEELNA